MSRGLLAQPARHAAFAGRVRSLAKTLCLQGVDMSQLLAVATIAYCLCGSLASAGTSLEGLVRPCRVIEFGYYLDGGTNGGRLVDAGGDTLEFCVGTKSSIHMVKPGEKAAPLEPCSFFVGSDSPGAPDARQLEICGAEENQLLAVLLAWVDQVLPDAEFGDLRRQYSSLTGMLQRHEFVEQSQLTNEQARALHVGIILVSRAAECASKARGN
jgi:hypothetical protein